MWAVPWGRVGRSLACGWCQGDWGEEPGVGAVPGSGEEPGAWAVPQGMGGEEPSTWVVPGDWGRSLV